ncbi:MAG: NAD(P)/FAD-dependent oxidoreductase [Cyclobacteriaceae bacterium]|nr:NAD(P)/FAD-dependent oxidoreductase [Cyclobacteriaceae bacterium]
MEKVGIVGGGLAGLVASVVLARNGIQCILFEKREYPFHRVCGEYVSNEVLPFLKEAELFPSHLDPPHIDRLWLTSVGGRMAEMPLSLGGFGVSRKSFDFFLYQKALAAGVDVRCGIEIMAIERAREKFLIRSADETFETDVVIGAQGKRSRIDVQQGRAFMTKRSPYAGVKYHAMTKQPRDTIALHNFSGGYCGVSQVEGGVSNICYLVHRNQLRRHGSVKELERKVLWNNPFLRELFTESQWQFDKPEVISEITFEVKEPVYNHILMVGDAAGMITPLCGNGMAMAIRSGKTAADLVIRYIKLGMDRAHLEEQYRQWWHQQFSTHLWMGRQIQRLFGGVWTSNQAVNLCRYFPSVASLLIRQTHGKPFGSVCHS